MTGTEIVRSGAEPVPLALLGSTPAQVLDRATELADALAKVVRDRGLALRLGDAERDFLTLHAWQVLAAFVGVVVVVESTAPLADGSGWQARASVRTGDDRTVAAGEGMCLRAERNWRTASDHSLRAMAQTRAMRRAYQGALGFIPGLAGMDVADPTAPATRRQVVALHALAGELGLEHDEAHRRAGVASFNDLTREQAGELMDTWGDQLEGTHDADGAGIPTESETPQGGGAQPGATLEQLWARAIAACGGSKVGVLRAHLERVGRGLGVSAADLTEDDLRDIIARAPGSQS